MLYLYILYRQCCIYIYYIVNVVSIYYIRCNLIFGRKSPITIIFYKKISKSLVVIIFCYTFALAFTASSLSVSC